MSKTLSVFLSNFITKQGSISFLLTEGGKREPKAHTDQPCSPSAMAVGIKQMRANQRCITLIDSHLHDPLLINMSLQQSPSYQGPPPHRHETAASLLTPFSRIHRGDRPPVQKKGRRLVIDSTVVQTSQRRPAPLETYGCLCPISSALAYHNRSG